MKYFSIIGIILFIIILAQINIKQLLSMLFNSNYLLLALAFAVAIIEVTLRSAKWKKLVNVFNKGYTLKDALQTYLIGFAFGAVTPSKTGDLVKIVDLKSRTGIEIKKCFSISVFDRIIDFLNLVFTAIVSTAIAIVVFSGLRYILVPVFAIMLALFLVVLFGLTRHSKIILKPF